MFIQKTNQNQQKVQNVSCYASYFLNGLKIHLTETIENDHNQFDTKNRVNDPWGLQSYQSWEYQFFSKDRQPVNNWHIFMEFVMILAKAWILSCTYGNHQYQKKDHADNDNNGWKIE